MKEQVTVDEAIAKGHRMVTYPGLLIFIVIVGICIYLGVQNILPFWIFLVGFLLAFVFAWIYWSVMITKWRNWAFESVRNVHELKKRAIQEQLIWADSKIFGKTEIKTAKDKVKWKTIQQKFKQEDLFQDDLSIPYETTIFYSKGKNYMEMIVMFILMAVGIYSLIDTDEYYGILLIVLGAYFGFREFKEATNKEPQIIINNEGIKTRNTQFYQWKDIRNEEAVLKGFGKNTRHYLVYDYPNGTEELLIEDLTTDHIKLNKLLILYRGRSEHNSANT